MEFHRTAGGGFVLRFLDFGDFVLDPQSDWSVTGVPLPDVPEQTMRDLYANQVVPLILGYQGGLVLHASCVATAGGALAFVGPTGRGKSTLAASFTRLGYPFLTDDGLILSREGDGYVVRPNVPRFRLRQDSELALFGGPGETEQGEPPRKRHIAARPSLPFQETPVRLHSLFFLGTGAAPSLEIVPMTPAEALSAQMGHSFILDVEDRQRVRAHFERLAELARAAPCFALDYPRDYDYLPNVVAAILDHAGVGGLAA